MKFDTVLVNDEREELSVTAPEELYFEVKDELCAALSPMRGCPISAEMFNMLKVAIENFILSSFASGRFKELKWRRVSDQKEVHIDSPDELEVEVRQDADPSAIRVAIFHVRNKNA